MELPQLLRLGHALAGVAFAAGIVGNWVIIGFARRAPSLETMRLYLQAATPFGNLLTGGGVALTVLGVATAVALDHPLFGPLQGGRVDWLFVANLLMLPLVPAVAVVYPRVGRRIRTALKAAEEQGVLTADLAAAWADPRLRWARTYEAMAIAIVLGLMIAKPF